MRRPRRKTNSCPQSRDNLLIIAGLFGIVFALLFRATPEEQVREVYLLLGMIIGSLTTFLNHSTQESGQTGVNAGTVENVTVEGNSDTQELDPAMVPGGKKT